MIFSVRWNRLLRISSSPAWGERLPVVRYCVRKKRLKKKKKEIEQNNTLCHRLAASNGVKKIVTGRSTNTGLKNKCLRRERRIQVGSDCTEHQEVGLQLPVKAQMSNSKALAPLWNPSAQERILECGIEVEGRLHGNTSPVCHFPRVAWWFPMESEEQN